MFVRKVSVRLKSNTLGEFATLIESEVLPWLRTQEGFLHLITLAASDKGEVQVLSFWDHEANAQAYNERAYPIALKNLATLLDGVPYVRTFEVVSSTLRELVSLRPRDTISADTHTRCP
jgi:hypothetical protein